MDIWLSSLNNEEYYVALPVVDKDKNVIMEKNDEGKKVAKVNKLPYRIGFKSDDHIKGILIDDFVKRVTQLESESYYRVLQYLFDIGMTISSVATEKKTSVEEFPGNFNDLSLNAKTYYRAKIFTFPAIEHILKLYNEQTEEVALELAAAHSNF